MKFDRKPEQIQTVADFYPNSAEWSYVLKMDAIAAKKESESQKLASNVEVWKSKAKSIRKRSDGRFDERSAAGRFMNNEFQNLKRDATIALREAQKARHVVPELANIYNKRRRQAVHRLSPPFFLKTLISVGFMFYFRPAWAISTFILLIRYTTKIGLSQKSFVKKEISKLEIGLGIDSKTGNRQMRKQTQ